MLPDVQREKRRRARGKQVLAVGSRDDLQGSTFGDEPRPTAPELPTAASANVFLNAS